MDKHNNDSSEEVLAYDGLSQLAQKGRALHDRAVCEALAGLFKLICLPVRGCFSAPVDSDKAKFPEHRGAASRS